VRLFHKIALLLVAAAAIPLGTVGFAVVAANQRALETEVRARFDQTARHAAEAIAADVEGRARQLAQTATLISWDRLNDKEARGAIELMRRQARADGAALYGAGSEVRAATDAAIEAQLAGHAPLERARREGAGAIVFSPPYSTKDGPAIAAAIAVGQPAPSATGTWQSGVLALLLPLQPAARRLDEVRGEQALQLSLVDDAGHAIARSAPHGVTTASPAAVADALAGKDGHARRFIGPDGHALIAAFARVGGLGWSVIAEEDALTAFAAPRRMRDLTLLMSGGAALLAVALAFVFAGRLTAALGRLAHAARALGQGQLDARVPARGGRDELRELANTFNQMGAEIQQRRGEIETLNRELEARVEARTRELKEAQAQLVQAQKLAALGQLGAGVAHEINNPLGGVIGHVQLLLADKKADHPDYEDLRCIDEAARRASQVVQNLLRFSVQHQQPVHTTVDLNKLVKDTLTLTSTVLADQKIALDLELDGDAPRVRGDAGQVAQVLLNLASNARTAMPAGGTLKVSTRAADGQIALAVADTGKGIDPAIRERIFEPFFTTKDDWSNVGLGLSVSYRIVEEHGGRIDVASEPGRGSTFTVYFPASA
jgi:signal transduction histidine kinase